MAKTDIWDLWQYNSPLSFHRTGLSWSAKKNTGWSTRKDGEFEEVQVVRIWDYAAGPWWLGLVVSGLRRAELPLSDAVPRPLSLSLSADHTLRPVTLGRWPLSVRPVSGHSQARPLSRKEANQSHFVQSALPRHSFRHPILWLMLVTSQTTTRNLNPQANLLSQI